MPEKGSSGKTAGLKHPSLVGKKPARIRPSKRQKKRYLLFKFKGKAAGRFFGKAGRHALENAFNSRFGKPLITVIVLSESHGICRCARPLAVSGKAKQAINASGLAESQRTSGTIKSLKGTLFSGPKTPKMP